MIHIEQIKQWIEANSIAVDWTSDIAFNVGSKSYLCVGTKQGKIFDAEFNIILEGEELQEILIDHYCFMFGGKVYTSPVKSEKIELNLFKHIGKAKDLTGFPYLGIHGGYELCNGSRVYEDWMAKAKFLGVEAAALAERHTLAGSLKFQQAAKKAGIKSIVGETITVKSGDEHYKLKLYVKDEIGWANILRINKELNVLNNGTHVDFLYVLSNSEGLYCIIQNDVMLDDYLVVGLVDLEKSQFAGVYFQFDPSEYKAENRDVHCLNCLKNYFANYKDVISLALVIDSYYLDKEDSNVRKILSFIGKGGFEFQSDDQYFKSIEEVGVQSIALFEKKGEDFALDILESAINGTNEIVNGCTYQIKTGEIHLPKYEMTSEEKKSFKTNEELFWAVIETGLLKKVEEKGKDVEVYLNRIQIEAEVLLKAGLEDYMLMLYDLVKWCRENNILTGIGRGSAAGSLISYCMSITDVDPLEYGLLFERFVNPGRLPKLTIDEHGNRKLVGGSLADIDIDVLSHKRDVVKKYLEDRWGKHNVCSIGTYSTLKSKAAFRDLLRFHGEQPQNINYFAGMIEDSNEDYHSLFHATVGNDKLKNFINEHLEATQDVVLLLGQPKSASVHASGIVITPSEGGRDIYSWFPCKLMDGMVVSEYEGTQLDEGGFLKLDLLGLHQLDKFAYMIDLIKENHKVDLALEEIDLNDSAVYDLFKRGMNQDVFQFNSNVMASYCREFEPNSIEDLTFINAVNRPGPMGSGTHTDAVKVKHGKKEVEYDYMTEEITKNTYGYAIFQEQVMQVCVTLGGFSLVEADDIRKAMGKKLEEKIKPYRERFVEGAIRNGCETYVAENVWNKLELFAGYGFNKSHSAAYAITGYRCQWIKQYFPLEFWTISLQHADDKEVPSRVAELRKFDTIKLYGPDINKSKSSFFTDWEDNAIYWSIGRIKHVGEVALQYIDEEKKRKGQFFSLEEFIKRCKSQAVNSRVVKHLIFSGCFDKLEDIDHPMARKKLINQFDELYGVETEVSHDEFFWYKMQRNLSGFGFFDYSTIVDDLKFDYNEFITAEQVQLEANIDCPVVVAGILLEVVKRKTKKGEMAKLTIDCNNDLIDVVLWNDVWTKVNKQIEEAEDGSGIMLNGKIQYDGYNKKNAVYSTDKTEPVIF